MRVTLNLASQPYEDARRFVRQWSLMLGLVGLLTLLLVAGAVLRRKQRLEFLGLVAVVASLVGLTSRTRPA